MNKDPLERLADEMTEILATRINEKKLSDYDRENIGNIIAGEGDWFTAQLIRLVVKADPLNRLFLALGFPEVVGAVEEWEAQ